jgi:hypothetical protein
MAYTQTDLARIEKAIAKGERVVWFGDRRVEYRSIDELRKAREDILRELGGADPAAKPRPRQARVFHAGKGT